MEQILADLANKQHSYQPNETAKQHLNDITMTAIIGPVAVGKNTSIDEVLALDPEFGRVRSFTTRPQRPGEADTQYEFMMHDEDNVRKILNMAINGDLVQYAVHPTTGHVYGSYYQAYDHRYMLLDILSSGVDTFRQLPFGKLVEITLVAEPEEWFQRFQDREARGQDAHKRIVEGIQSLEWSLGQESEMIWVCSPQGRAAETAEEIRDIVKGQRQPNPANRQIGERLLAKLQSLA